MMQEANANVGRIVEQSKVGPGADGERDLRVVVDFSDVLTYRTLAAIDDTLPAPLILGLLEPDGPTMMYGAPGVGKGMTAAWLVCELLRIGKRPMIYDAEARPREWARRVSGLGGERWKVGYVSPADLGPARAGRPLWENIEQINVALGATGSNVLIVDSALPAIGVGEDRLKSDAQAPYLFVQALDSLGVPSLTLGHPPKGASDGDPFGSMAWVAAMRLTWIGQRAEGGAEALHRVRWSPRKRNERGELPAVLLTFHYDAAGRLSRVERTDDAASTRDRIIMLLRVAANDSRGGMTVAELTDEWIGDSDDRLTAADIDKTRMRIGKALNRMKRDSDTSYHVRVDKGGGPGAKWYTDSDAKVPNSDGNHAQLGLDSDDD